MSFGIKRKKRLDQKLGKGVGVRFLSFDVFLKKTAGCLYVDGFG